jgi:hypothetical protein
VTQANFAEAVDPICMWDEDACRNVAGRQRERPPYAQRTDLAGVLQRSGRTRTGPGNRLPGLYGSVMSLGYVGDLSSPYRKVGSNSGTGSGNSLKHNRSFSFSSAARMASSKPGVATARTSASVFNSNPPGQGRGAAAADPAAMTDPRAIPSVLIEVTRSRLDMAFPSTVV